MFAVYGKAWETGLMRPRRFFNLLVALTVAAGLLSGPFAAPSVAKSQAATVGGEVHAMDGGMHAFTDGVMADGMPCCPDDGKPAKDCDSCPLMALCAMTIPMPAPSGTAVLVPGQTAQTPFAFPDDLPIDGFGPGPPDHPPRNMI